MGNGWGHCRLLFLYLHLFMPAFPDKYHLLTGVVHRTVSKRVIAMVDNAS